MLRTYFFLAFLLPSWLLAQPYYVHPNGNDTAAGTANTPWQSLRRNLLLILQLIILALLAFALGLCFGLPPLLHHHPSQLPRHRLSLSIPANLLAQPMFGLRIVASPDLGCNGGIQTKA